MSRIMHIPTDVLGRPAAEAVRWLALSRLHDLREAAPADGTPMDARTLHDFRVALRRLRSAIRAHRSVLDDTVSKKTRRRLQRLADATAPSREADVHLAWLANEKKSLVPSERPAATWLRRRLEREKRRSDRRLRRELDRDFARVCERARSELSRYAVIRELGEDDPPRTGAAHECAVLHSLADEFSARRRAMGGMDDDRQLHRFRIAGKRLRYELEATMDALAADAPAHAAAESRVERLHRLQDQLGEVHDAHVFGRWLADRAAEAAAKRARERVLAEPQQNRHVRRGRAEESPEAGIAVLEQRLRDHAQIAFDAVCAEWSGDAGHTFVDEIHQLADEVGAARIVPAAPG